MTLFRGTSLLEKIMIIWLLCEEEERLHSYKQYVVLVLAKEGPSCTCLESFSGQLVLQFTAGDE